MFDTLLPREDTGHDWSLMAVGEAAEEGMTAEDERDNEQWSLCVECSGDTTKIIIWDGERQTRWEATVTADMTGVMEEMTDALTGAEGTGNVAVEMEERGAGMKVRVIYSMDTKRREAQLVLEDKEGQWVREWEEGSVVAKDWMTGEKMTALNRHRLPLSGLDLSGACLSGACLDYACLARTDFTNADLTGCSIRNANLDGAILKGALLDAVQLGEPEWVGKCRGPVRALAVAPSQQWVVVGTWNSLEAWDVETLKSKWEKQMKDGVPSVCVTHDGEMIVCSRKRKITLLTKDGEVVTEKDGANVRCLSLSIDDGLLAGGLWDKKIKLWSMPELDLLGFLEGHLDDVTAVQWLDELRLVYASLDNTIRLWSVPEQRVVLSLNVKSTVHSLCISPSRELIAVGVRKHSITIVNASSFTRIASLAGHTGVVNSLCFHPLNDDILLSGSSDHYVRVWNVPNQSCMSVLHAHTGSVSSLSFSPDASFFISGSVDKTIDKWNSESALQSSEIDPFHPSLSWSVAHCVGRLLMAKVVDGRVHLMNIDGSGGVRVFGESRNIYSVDISADDSLVASSTDKTTKIYSSSDLSLLRVIDGAFSRLCFSSDCELLAACYGMTIYCFSLSASGFSFSIAAPARICALTFISHYLAAGCENGSIIIIDICTQSIVKMMDVGSHFVAGLQSLDDHHFASVSMDGSIRTWYIPTGHCCFIREGLPELYRVVKHPSSGLIAMADKTGRAFIWSVDAEYSLSLVQFGNGVHLLSAHDCQLDEHTNIDRVNLTILNLR